MERLRSVQVLRAVAACAVAWLHARYFAAAHPVGIARIGGAGVDLFFVISGFIMASIPRHSPGAFLFDRFWRVFPMWLIAVAPWLLWEHPDWRTTLSSLTLWPVYDEFTTPALGVGWTLSFEMLFYVSLALAIRTNWRLPIALYALALIGGMATGWPIFQLIGNPMTFEFLFGMTLARLPRNERLAPALVAVGALWFAAAPLDLFFKEFALELDLAWARAALWGLPAALIVYGCICLERHFKRPAFDGLVKLGDASYSIYLFHLAAIRLLHLHWVAELVLSIAAGVLAWRLIERPILRLKPVVQALCARVADPLTARRYGRLPAA